jgi:signal transduction histidine kinase
VSGVIDEGRTAVRGLRSTHSSSLDLEEALAQVQQELGLRREVDFRIIVEGERRPLRPLLRDEVYRIGREALVNAFRHSQGKNVELEIDYAPKQLRLMVRDNGVGIDPQVLRAGRDGHWGMQGMRERAERIGARLKVWSSAAVGTEVELSIPKHVAFQVSGAQRRFSWLPGLDSRRDPNGFPSAKNRRNE